METLLTIIGCSIIIILICGAIIGAIEQRAEQEDENNGYQSVYTTHELETDNRSDRPIRENDREKHSGLHQ